MKLLYSLVKTKNYWFIIYPDYYSKKFSIKKILYNRYLLIFKDEGDNFDIIKFYINNILNIKVELFMNIEKVEIIRAKFNIKS